MPELARKIRISTSADVAATVPMLFGYHPDSSVVVLSLVEDKIGTSMRMDTAPVEEVHDAVRRYFPAERLTILMVVYSDSPDYAASVLASLQEGFKVREALRVHDGRWFPLLCANPICCPTEGTLVEPVSTEMTVALGLQPTVASRDELRDLYAADNPVQVSADLCPEPLVDGVERFVRIQALLADGAEVPGSSVGQMLVNLTDVLTRDALVSQAMVNKTERQSEEVFAYLARRAPAGQVAAPTTCAAVLAWQCGSGTRARIAIEAALADDEGYRLARLVEMILDCGMDPASVGSF